MTSIAYSPVSIQASVHSAPSLPCWFGEMTLIAHHLQRQGVLAAIEEQVRGCRVAAVCRYEVIDFVAVLFGYATSGERTLEAFYQRLQPWASAFMALFGRERLPARSTLSRFLASLDQAAVEALRTLFLQDLLARPLVKEEQPGGLWDRQGNHFLIFDSDGTREAARQRALPQTADRPVPQRRLGDLCAAGYTGRKRGEVVRTRTTVVQAHTHQWLATFGNSGNGQYRAELRRAVAAIQCWSLAHDFPEARLLLRLDGQYGTGAVLADLAGFSYVMRGKDYQLLDRAEVQARLQLPPDQQFSRPESQMVRSLYDCPDVAMGPSGLRCRVVVATHPAGTTKSRIGVTRAGVVYELFLTDLPQQAFTAADVVALYLHRGAFEHALADEDLEQDEGLAGVVMPPGVRSAGKSSLNGCGTSAWNWAINFILILCARPSLLLHTSWRKRRLPTRFLRCRGMDQQSKLCPGNETASLVETLPPSQMARCAVRPGSRWLRDARRREADGSLRVVYAASIRSCRPCLLREQCQWHGTAATKPRRVSVMLHPLIVGSAPLLWRDWSRRLHRRACLHLLRQQQVEVLMEPGSSANLTVKPSPLSRAERAHYRLSWAERLARNARSPAAGQVMIRLFGVPEGFATSLGLATA